MLRDNASIYVYRFRDENRKSMAYWRDVGTLDAYYQANMDLVAVDPVLNLYDAAWPIRTLQPQLPPAKFVFGDPGEVGVARRGEAIDSLVSSGCIVSGGHIERTVLSPRVRVNSYATVEDSILFEGVDIGRHCRIRKAIIDKRVRIPADTVLGYDREADERRGFTITESGIVVVPSGQPERTFQG
jgi:glucose-1-phosphate adenylyltransferase